MWAFIAAKIVKLSVAILKFGKKATNNTNEQFKDVPQFNVLIHT